MFDLSCNLFSGVIIFLYGMKVNMGGDTALRNLRRGSETGYKVPTGMCINFMWLYPLIVGWPMTFSNFS